MIALVVLTVLVASTVQRVTGMGFAMLLAPFAVLVLGAGPGVLLVNALGIISAMLVMVRVRRDIHWPTARGLLPTAAIGVLIGVGITQVLSPAGAQVAAGTVVVLALLASMVVVRTRTIARTASATATAGITSGLMGALAGVGGSAMVVLAVLTRWEPRTFAATMQPYFALLGMITIAARLVADPGAWPQFSVFVWVCLGIAMFAGLALGEKLTVSPTAARNAVILLAGAGGLITIIDGSRSLTW